MNLAWAFCMAYNEAPLIGYWVRHALTFADRAIVYVDTESDDGTAEIVTAEGGEARPYDSGGIGFDDTEFSRFANMQYREARRSADWVIWTDADEFLYHPRLSDRLRELHGAGVNLPRVTTWYMLPDAPPTHDGQIYAEAPYRRGVHIPEGDKIAVFDPNVLTVQWTEGKHSAHVSGPVERDTDNDDVFRLLHYRWLGEDWFRARNERNCSRLSARNLALGLGFHVRPEYTGPYTPEWFHRQAASAQEVV